jgi:hypothetical protein
MIVKDSIDNFIRKMLGFPKRDEEWYFFFDRSFHIPKAELLKHGWEKKPSRIDVIVTDNEIILKRVDKIIEKSV